MENFVVSALKYRPARFDSVVGQGHIVGTLKKAIKTNHLAHSFLFCGPRGVGKTTCARILAKTINCENLSDDIVACDQCNSCRSFNESASFNIHEIDAASNNSVEGIRNLIDQVRFPPQSGKYKIYIIDEVHMLSQSAFNAFLKTLEEPPPYAIFILATTEKHKIIPTILSRCQIFDFNRIKIEDMVEHLAGISANENINAETDGLHLIAQKADGALRDALSIFDRIASYAGNKITYEDVIENLNILDYDYYFRLSDHFLNQDVPSVLVLYDEILKKGFEGEVFLEGLSLHLRNLLVCKDPSTLKIMEVTDSLKQRYSEQAGKFSVSYLLNALNLANICDLNYKTSKNKRLQIELTLIKISLLDAAVSIAKNPNAEVKKKPVKELKALEKEVAAPVKASPPTIDQKEKKVDAESPKEVERAENSKTGSHPILPSIKKIPSLKGIRNTHSNKAPEAEKKEASPEQLGENTDGISTFNESEVISLWKEFAAEVMKDQMSIGKVMESAALRMEGNVLKVMVENTLESTMLKTALSSIGERYRNRNIRGLEMNLEIDPSKADTEKRAYTSTEKLKKMEEKNPLIKELKDKLGLELEF